MKKLILLLALLCLPLVASAQQGDALLTPDGTMFTINYERAKEHPDVETDSQIYLLLTARRGDEVTREIVPATADLKGSHSNPAIAYDAQSGMLFAFWIHNSGMLSNQLMFASRASDGTWSDAVSFGVYYNTRHNLRIAVTRKIEDHEGNLRNGLVVHLSWWQFNFETNRHEAQYMLLAVNRDGVADMMPVDLNEFIPKNLEPATTAVDSEVLRQPLLFTSARQDSVLVVYGDLESATLHNVRITPKVGANGRLRVPGGKREVVSKSPTLETGEARIEGVYGDNDRMAFYAESGGKLRYVLLKDGEWSAQRTISLDEQLSQRAVIDALRRLVSEH